MEPTAAKPTYNRPAAEDRYGHSADTNNMIGIVLMLQQIMGLST